MKYDVIKMIEDFGLFLEKKSPVDSEDYNLLVNFVASFLVLIKNKTKDELDVINAEVNLQAKKLDEVFPKHITGRN